MERIPLKQLLVKAFADETWFKNVVRCIFKIITFKEWQIVSTMMAERQEASCKPASLAPGSHTHSLNVLLALVDKEAEVL